MTASTPGEHVEQDLRNARKVYTALTTELLAALASLKAGGADDQILKKWHALVVAHQTMLKFVLDCEQRVMRELDRRGELKSGELDLDAARRELAEKLAELGRGA